MKFMPKFDVSQVRTLCEKAAFVGGVAALVAYQGGSRDWHVLVAAALGAASSFLRNAVYLPTKAAAKKPAA
jgi:hypothetical protein